jgi:hypothetical protein
MPSDTEHDEALLEAHRLHTGVYRRVADKLGVDPSYVSRVATGQRDGVLVRDALLDELRKIARYLSESAQRKKPNSMSGLKRATKGRGSKAVVRVRMSGTGKWCRTVLAWCNATCFEKRSVNDRNLCHAESPVTKACDRPEQSRCDTRLPMHLIRPAHRAGIHAGRRGESV